MCIQCYIAITPWICEYGHFDVYLCSENITWHNVLQCVNQELFPVLSVKINECVQEKLLKDSAFKMSDIGTDAVEDIIERLMKKRTMNNKEITYLKELFERANEYGQSGDSQKS